MESPTSAKPRERIGKGKTKEVANAFNSEYTVLGCLTLT